MHCIRQLSRWSLVNHHVLRSLVLLGRLPSHRTPRVDAAVLADSATTVSAVPTMAPTTLAEQSWARASVPIKPLPPWSRTCLPIPATTHCDHTVCPVAAAVPVPHHRQSDKHCWSFITTVCRPCNTHTTHPRVAAHHRARRNGQSGLPSERQDNCASREKCRVQGSYPMLLIT